MKRNQYGFPTRTNQYATWAARIVLILVIFGLIMVAGCVSVPTIDTKIDQMLKTVVKVERVNDEGSGSGVVVFSEDYTLIVSAKHVTDGQEKFNIIMHDRVVEATMVRESETHDLALLRVEGHYNYVAHLHSVNLRPFDEIFIVGAGDGFSPYPAMGIVANPYNNRELRPQDTDEVLQVSAPTISGDSGGGIFRQHHDHYALVGILTAQRQHTVQFGRYYLGVPVDNVGHGLHVKVVQDFLNEG